MMRTRSARPRACSHLAVTAMLAFSGLMLDGGVGDYRNSCGEPLADDTLLVVLNAIFLTLA